MSHCKQTNVKLTLMHLNVCLDFGEKCHVKKKTYTNYYWNV